MDKYYYSPSTGELIESKVKRDWFGVTSKKPPKTNNNESAFFNTETNEWYIKVSEKEKKTDTEVRSQRDQLLSKYDKWTERHKEQKELEIQTDLTDEDYMKLLRYKQYLRDIPQSEQFPEIEIITFEDFE